MDFDNFLVNINECLTTKSVDNGNYQHLISGVSSGKIKFLSLVEKLQDVLTNENINVRERGIEFLARVITDVSEELFSCAEVTVLVNFFCDCLKGHHNLLPATLKGLLALIKIKHISKEDTVNILVNLFQQVNCHTQLQVDRYNIYSILRHVVCSKLEDVRPMGPDFIFGIISCIEGETDPQCLKLVFEFLPLFIRQFDLGHLSEELFEVLFCYFPVDFNRAANDACTVTREDLSEGLLQCLTASEAFCIQCLEVVFEKLDSNFKMAKLDSYKVLLACVQNIKADNLEKHLNELWRNIQKDVLPGTDKEICQAALLTLADVVWLLSREESNKDVLLKFLSEIFATVKTLASRVNENMFQPVMSVLIATSAKSKLAAGKVLCFLKPYYQLVDSKVATELKTILFCLLPFSKISSKCKIYETEDSEEKICYVELLNLFLHSAKFDDSDVRKLAYSGICDMILGYTEEARQKLYEIVIRNLKTTDDIKTSVEFFGVIRDLAQNQPKELYELLFENVKITPSNLEPYTAGFLWALSLLADHPNFTSFVVPVLMEFVLNGQHSHLGLESLLNACRCAKDRNSANFYSDIQKEHNALQRLLFWWQNGTVEDEESVAILSESIALIVRNQNSVEQQAITNEFAQVLASRLTHLSSSTFESSDKESSVKIDQTLEIMEAVLGSVRPEVTIPDMSTVRDFLLSTAVNSHVKATQMHASRLLASLMNKSVEPLDADILIQALETINKELEKPGEFQSRYNCALLYTWMIKGVMLKGGPSFEEHLFKWFDALGREDMGEILAENAHLVFEAEDLYLNFESHCHVRVLYRQRIFGYFSKLVKVYELSSELVKANYLLGLVRILEGIPKHLIQVEIAHVVILLLQCLRSDKPDILVTSLGILRNLLEEREKILADHTGSFVLQLLRLATYAGHMKIRMEALKCLFFYGFYETFVLLPLKSRVIRELETCVDDKKRLVRKEAVRARCRWFLVGSPGEDILKSS